MKSKSMSYAKVQDAKGPWPLPEAVAFPCLSLALALLARSNGETSPPPRGAVRGAPPKYEGRVPRIAPEVGGGRYLSIR